MFIAGPYYWTYQGAPLGVLQDALRIRRTPTYEEITGDDFGDTIQGLVYRGGNTFIDMVLLEWDFPAVQALAESYGEIIDRGESPDEPSWGQIGRSAINVASDGTPTITSNGHAVGMISPTNDLKQYPNRSRLLLGQALGGQYPQWIRAENAILAPNQDTDTLFGSRARVVPLSLISLPWFEPTNNNDNPATDVNRVYTIRYTQTAFKFQ